MKAGFAQVDFTPLYGFMPGEFQGYFAQGAHLPLCANTGAFGEGENTVILIAADYMQFPTHSLCHYKIRENYPPAPHRSQHDDTLLRISYLQYLRTRLRRKP